MAYFCSPSKVLFGCRVGEGGGPDQANRQTPIRFPRAKGYLGALAALATRARRCVGVHGWRVANVSRCGEGRQRLTNSFRGEPGAGFGQNSPHSLPLHSHGAPTGRPSADRVAR